MRTQLVLLSGLFGTCAVAALAGGPWTSEPNSSVRKSVRAQVVSSETVTAAPSTSSGNGVVQFVANESTVQTERPAPPVTRAISPVVAPVLDHQAASPSENGSGIVEYVRPENQTPRVGILPNAKRATVKAVDAEPALPMVSPQIATVQREPLPINQPLAITQPVVEGEQSDLPPLPKFEVPGLHSKTAETPATPHLSRLALPAPTPSREPIPRPEQTVDAEQAKAKSAPFAKPVELTEAEKRTRLLAEQQRLAEQKRPNEFRAPQENHPAINNPVVKATEPTTAQEPQSRLVERPAVEASPRPAPTVPMRQQQPAIVAAKKPAQSPQQGSEMSELEKRTRALAEQERIAELRRSNEFQPPKGHHPTINNPVVKATQPATPAVKPQQSRLVERPAVAARPEPAPAVVQHPQEGIASRSQPSARPVDAPQADNKPAKKPETTSVAQSPPVRGPVTRRPQASPPRVAQAPASTVPRQSRPAQSRVAARPAAPAVRQRPAATANSNQLRMPPFIAQQVAQHVDYGQDLADRGATHSARSEYMRALDVVAHALDAQQNSDYHRKALREALTALEEADDLTPHVEQGDAGWRRSVEKHSTPVLKMPGTQNMHPFVAMQKYCEFAGQRLVAAMGNEPSASKALYGMARLELWMETPTTSQASLAGPRAIVLHQAALRVDANNFQAANELGVLFAKYGQFEQARAAFLHSIRVEPQPVTWKNLAKVSNLLGDRETAHAAKHQQQWLAKKLEGTQGNPGGAYSMGVTMVDPITFANLPSSEHAIGPTTPHHPATQPASVTTAPAQPAVESTKKPIVARVFDSLR